MRRAGGFSSPALSLFRYVPRCVASAVSVVTHDWPSCTLAFVVAMNAEGFQETRNHVVGSHRGHQLNQFLMVEI